MSRTQLGADAEFILNSTIHKDTMDGIEQHIVNKLKKSPVDGSEKAIAQTLELVRQLRAIELHNAVYREMIASGKIDEHRFDAKKLKRFGVV